MSYNKDSKEVYAAIAARMLFGEKSVADINRETGININRLYRWKDEAEQTG